jgi:hypothetical protein
LDSPPFQFFEPFPLPFTLIQKEGADETVGIEEGAEDIEGAFDTVGTDEGTLEGSSLGASDGTSEGMSVGSSDGVDEG